jgi:hypothetical protein
VPSVRNPATVFVRRSDLRSTHRGLVPVEREGPTHIATTPDGEWAFIAEIDPSTLAMRRFVEVGLFPVHAAFVLARPGAQN